MDPDLRISQDEARDRLEFTNDPPLASPADRRIHALGFVAVGTGHGMYAAVQNVLDGAASTAVTAAFVGLWLAAVFWVGRLAGTIPRGVRHWAWFGIGGSLLLALAVVRPWLNLQAQQQPNSWPAVAAAAVIIASPCFVAAAAVAPNRTK